MNSNRKYQSKNENPQFIFLEKIRAMFITIIEKEKITNNLKISLSDSSDLNLITYFNEIDKNNMGYIDVINLQSYLQDNYIFLNELTIRRFIHQYDKNQKFSLVYNDFRNIFKPYIDYSNDYIQINNDLSTKDKFLNILKSTLELIEKINEMTTDIRKSNNFTTYEAFMGITKGNKYLDEEFMTHFLEHNYNSKEIRHLIYIIDLNNDSVISYEEFQDFFTPLINEKQIKIDKIDNNYEFDINLKENLLNKYNIYNENNLKEKYDNNDIVNYEKSGIYNFKKKEHNRNINNIFDEDDKKYCNTFTQKVNNNFGNISSNKTINFDSGYEPYNTKNNIYNSFKDYDEYIDKYNTMKDFKFNKIKYFSKYNKLTEEKNKENDMNKYNILDDRNIRNNNKYENDNDKSNKYSNSNSGLFEKTKEIISSSSKNSSDIYNDYNDYMHNNNNKREDIKCYNYKEKKCTKLINSEKNNKPKKSKKLSISLYKNDTNYNNNKTEYFNDKYGYGFEKMNRIWKNGLKIEKNVDINLSYKDKIDKYNLKNKNKNDLIENKDYKININDFTCGKRTEREEEDTNANINIDIDKDKLNILNENDRYTDNFNFGDKINEEILNKKLKEYTNSSLINFINYIEFLVEKEKNNIDNKDKLSLRDDVTLKDLFFIFDYNKKNNISKNEFKSVCKKLLGLYPTSDQIVLVFKRYDKNKDDNLNLNEFLAMIRPLKEEYANYLFSKKNSGNKNKEFQQLSNKSKKLLIEVIRGIIDNEGNYYKFKDDIINQNLLEIKDLWNSISKYCKNKKGINKFEMNKLLIENGCSLSQYELDIIYNKLDYDKDQFISNEDLTQEFVNYY